ncbi:MAG TPA: DUF2889 domain-containing protein [Dongiaceae bacterium]|nr:DUF2889 domain-containing protein [Dongiaceae bacterium]
MTATREAAADFTLSEHGRPALSQPVEREIQHFRDFQFAGYRRADGLFDIEGRMTDRKPYSFPNEWRGTVPVDDPLHDMRIRLTLDEHFLIHDVEVVTSASPYEICGGITPSFAALKGHHISKGWTRLLSETFGGHRGCVHHVELLRTMATVAFQTLYGWQERRKREAGLTKSDGPPAADAAPGKKPGFIDSCHALASDGDIVKEHWPQFYKARE